MALYKLAYIIIIIIIILRRGRYHGITSNRKLSSEVVAEKETRRHLESRWKKSQSDADRVIYRKACRKANEHTDK